MLDLFSEPVFVFRLDRSPDTVLLDTVPGVSELTVEEGPEGHLLVARVARDAAARSEALYSLVDSLRKAGHRLGGIHQRQQTLENIFLELTESA